MTLLWPRLQTAAARAHFLELRDLSRQDLIDRASTEHPLQTYASTGGSRISRVQLDVVRKRIVEAASEFGYPHKRPKRKRLVHFDRTLAPILFEEAHMAVGEALERSVWTFMSLVLAPDVTEWRFGFDTEERWICSDRTRHMFSRLWWQVHSLSVENGGGRDTTLLNDLSESELNQVLERTTIGGFPPLAQAIARRLVERTDGQTNRRELFRQSNLRLLRLLAVVDPYALSDEELDHLVDGAVVGAFEAMS